MSIFRDKIKARYQEIIDGLNLGVSLEDEFKVIEQDFKKAIGERIIKSTINL